MKKYIIISILLAVFILKAEYVVGDHVPDMQFVDTNVDSIGTIIYANQSTKDIILSGKIVVISFFGAG